ncbi:MAG: phosphotransferase [Candidatus Rokubacteria bacterium]|nr:phosphotransferase [Candidatus Rokubacteria bacterium]
MSDLPVRRWFGDKARAISGITPVDHAGLSGTGGVLALLRVDFATGPAETYCVPIIGAADLSRPGAIADALDDPAFCTALVEHIRLGSTLPGRSGCFRFRATTILAEVLPETTREATRVKTEQSNTSVIFDGRAILKIFRNVQRGQNPELEITGFLTRATSFRAAPRLAGSIEYEELGQEPITLGTLHEFVPNKGDAWTALQGRLGEYFAVAVTGPDAGGPPDPAFARALAAADAKEARTLGELTGRLHAALASPTAPAPMVPTPVGRADVVVWQDGMRARLDRVLAALASALDHLPADLRDLGRQALDRAPQLAERSAALQALVEEHVMKIRVHGDYHLGQVLRTDGGFVIVDFEGEPARPLAERRATQCALKDVAGMLRSYANAVRTAMLRAAEIDGGDSGLLDRLLPWANSWEAGVRAAFLDGYLAGTEKHAAGLLPRRRETIQSVLDAYEVDKAVYELDYELNHRPGWVRIPLDALLRATAPTPTLALPLQRPEGPFQFVACVELREFVGVRAEDERQLMDLIEQVPLDSVYYHTHGFFLRHKFLAGIYPNDFATWAAVHLRDQGLGERLAMVDPAEFENLEALRDQLVATIDEHLRRLPMVPRIVSAEPFDFVRSRIVEIPTGIETHTLEEFRQALLEIDVSAIYFHMVEARMRLGRGQNDFAAWLDRGLGLTRLAAQVQDVHPYGSSLERTRARLIQRLDETLAEGAGT